MQRQCIAISWAKANRSIIIVLDLDVLEELGECEKLGLPHPLDPKVEDVQPQSTTIHTGGFYGNNAQAPSQQQQQQHQQHQSLPSRTNTTTSSVPNANIWPIEALSPYGHKWTIKARCTNKSDIKTWHNKNGEGKLFSVNLLDESGEIRGTGFNDQCDALYDLFQEGGVYYISSPCRVQLAKKQFTNLNNDYELTFERDTVVEKVGCHIRNAVLTDADTLTQRPKSKMGFHKYASTSPVSVICSLSKKTPLSTP